jgi:uncharacterized membrane protein YdjX (TVP38/TMEM64 family)
MKITKKQITWSIILAVIIGALIILYYIGKDNGWFSLFESKGKLREYVMSFGALAPLAFFLLQFFQVIISPIPGNVTTLVGGMIFGFLDSFLISAAAIILGSICAFMLGKWFGRPLVEKIVGKRMVDKYMVSVSSRQKIMLILMFLLPFFPDDMLCLIAGLSAMSLPAFSLIVILTRPWGIVFSSLVGSDLIALPEWAWITIIIVVAALFVLSIKYAPIIEERSKKWLEKRFHIVKDDGN